MKVSEKAAAVVSAIQEAEKLANDLGDEDVVLQLSQVKLNVRRRAARMDRRRTLRSARTHFLRVAARLDRATPLEH
jgi:hypothetical protein